MQGHLQYHYLVSALIANLTVLVDLILPKYALSLWPLQLLWTQLSRVNLGSVAATKVAELKRMNKTLLIISNICKQSWRLQSLATHLRNSCLIKIYQGIKLKSYLKNVDIGVYTWFKANPWKYRKNIFIVSAYCYLLGHTMDTDGYISKIFIWWW